MRLRTSVFAVVLAGSLTAVPAGANAVPCAVTDTMIKVSATWVTKGPDLAANNWSNANFHVGNLAQVRTTGISNHKTWPWVQANKYLLPVDPANPSPRTPSRPVSRTSTWRTSTRSPRCCNRCATTCAPR